MSRIKRPSRRAIIEFFAIPFAYLIYEIIRAICGDHQSAFRNARFIVRAEKWLHMYWEPHLQQYFIKHKWFIQFLNFYYGTVHFVGPVSALISLWCLTKRENYVKWRNRLVALNLIALVGFWLYPLMPPRMLPHEYGIIDTDVLFGGAIKTDSGPGHDWNPYAAMPSLHFGWALWCAAAFGTVFKKRWQKLAIWFYPAFTFATITITGNHYFLDAVGGLLADIASYFVGDAATLAISKYQQRKHANRASNSVVA